MFQNPRSILIFLICFLFCFLPLSAFSQYLSVQPGNLETEFGVNYFSTKSNYSTDRAEVKLLDGDFYNLIDGQMSARYVLNPFWSIFGGAQYSQAESQTGILKRNNTGFNQMKVGGQYLLQMPAFEVIPEIALTFPLDSPALDSDFVPNNEGVTEFVFQSRMQKMFRYYSAFGNAGVNYRGSGRSTLFIWGGGMEMYSSMFTLGSELSGTFTLVNEAKPEVFRSENREIYLNRVAGGSKKFYAYNPTFVNAEVYAILHFTKSVGLGIHGGGLLTGTDVAAGYYGGLSFRMNFDFSSSGSPRSRVRSFPESSDRPRRVRRVRPTEAPPVYQEQLSTEEGMDSFQSESEKSVDQNLFQPPPPPRMQAPRVQEDGPVYRPRRVESPYRPPRIVPQKEIRSRPRPVVRKSRPVMRTRGQREKTNLPVFEDDLQSQLDETEMKIELKQNKKKPKGR